MCSEAGSPLACPGCYGGDSGTGHILDSLRAMSLKIRAAFIKMVLNSKTKI